MNKVVLTGRLTKDVELRYAQNGGLAIVKFNLAVDRRVKKEEGKQTADFINCTVFGKQAEYLANNSTGKGARVSVVGRIQTGSYKDKDGKTVYTTDIMVDELEVYDRKEKNGSSNQPQGDGKPTEDFMQIPDDIGESLPFD